MMSLLRKSRPRSLPDLTAFLLIVAMAAGAALGGGCYNPSITDGSATSGFICADAGKRCPDGFECSATDNHCHATVKCPVATVAPLCADPPTSGACNPACQTGCACGRCNVSGAAAVCSTTVGTLKVGEVCNPTKDNCAPGLICLLESDTCHVSNLGRCYQHCTATGGSAAAGCGAGRTCEIPILDGSDKDTGYRACSLATQTCTPTAAPGSNQCPSPGLTCYLAAGGATYCDCPNRTPPGILGASCDVYNDCGTGLICTASAGSVGNHCRTVCMQSGQNTCPNAQRCTPVGTVYGYCNG